MTVLLRFSCWLAVLAMLAVSCRVDSGDVNVINLGPTVSQGSQQNPAAIQSPPDVLPIVGPVPGASHWHAAYVVRICDDVLAPFDSTDDPLGIHSHSDGLIHIHPFFEQSGYEAATLGLFADAMGLRVGDGEITLPGGGTWRDGDLCNGVPGRVFVDRWRDPDPESSVERIFTGIDELRYLADGELYQLAFAPADSPPVVPPSVGLLDQVSNLSQPQEAWIDVLDQGASLEQMRFWPVARVGLSPCGEDGVSEQPDIEGARCYVPGDPIIAGVDAVKSARAVIFNRSPAVEITMTAALQTLISDHFASTDAPMGLGIQFADQVVTAPTLARPPVADRLVVSGGFSVASAQSLAAALSTEG